MKARGPHAPARGVPQASKKLQIKLPELEAVQVFSREGLKARLDALDQCLNRGFTS